VVAKSQNWSWKTVRALLQLRDPGLTGAQQLWKLEETYKGLAISTAEKVVSFLKGRETSTPATTSKTRRKRA
jgi:hypothetical protein